MENKYLEKVAKAREFKGQYGHAVDVHGAFEPKDSKVYSPEIQAAQNRRAGRLQAVNALQIKKTKGRAAAAGIAAGTLIGVAASLANKKKKKD